MTYYDLENRLVALGEDGIQCAVWSDESKEWKKGSNTLAGKAWADGEVIDPTEAARRFPTADQGKVPDLD